MEERAERVRISGQKRNPEPALLLVGCRNSHSDRLYATKLEKWQGEKRHRKVEQYMREAIPEKYHDLIPDFDVGCKVYIYTYNGATSSKRHMTPTIPL